MIMDDTETGEVSAGKQRSAFEIGGLDTTRTTDVDADDGYDDYGNRINPAQSNVLSPRSRLATLPPNTKKLCLGIVVAYFALFLVALLIDGKTAQNQRPPSSAEDAIAGGAQSGIALSSQSKNNQGFPYSNIMTGTTINNASGRFEINGIQSAFVTGVPTDSLGHTMYYVSNRRARLQINNYPKGSALMLNIHLPHHGGGRLCDQLGRGMGFGPVLTGKSDHGDITEVELIGTGYDCGESLMELRHDSLSFLSSNDTAANVLPDYPQQKPWSTRSTPHSILHARAYVHYLSWNFPEQQSKDRTWDKSIHLQDTGWDHTNLISILVLRHPLSRILAYTDVARPGAKNTTNTSTITTSNPLVLDDTIVKKDDSFLTDNLGLQILLGPDFCCDGELTNPALLEEAKKLLMRFTLVLDIECLQEGVEAIADLLNITLHQSSPEEEVSPIQPFAKTTKTDTSSPAAETSSKQQPFRSYYPSQEIYDYLAEKNKMEIQLYEWARTSLTLLQCGVWNNNM